jgi:hypothetical protein
MMGDAFAPVNLFEAGGQEAKGEQARMASIVGALSIADLVKSSLGPKGMDKILQSTSRGYVFARVFALLRFLRPSHSLRRRPSSPRLPFPRHDGVRRDTLPCPAPSQSLNARTPVCPGGALNSPPPPALSLLSSFAVATSP